MDIWKFLIIAGLLTGCSMKDLSADAAEPQVTIIVVTATSDRTSSTPTPTKQILPTSTIEPTPTQLPGWCYVDPTPYLEEVQRIIGETDRAVRSWNSSPRLRGDLLAAESSFRSMIRQAESLEPPEDFKTAHEHLLNAIHGTLHALFGITDNSETNLAGNDAARHRQLELAGEAIEQALSERDVVCWQE
jgi:hypothetical protein